MWVFVRIFISEFIGNTSWLFSSCYLKKKNSEFAFVYCNNLIQILTRKDETEGRKCEFSTRTTQQVHSGLFDKFGAPGRWDFYTVRAAKLSVLLQAALHHHLAVLNYLWLVLVAFPMNDHRPEVTERWLCKLNSKISPTTVTGVYFSLLRWWNVNERTKRFMSRSGSLIPRVAVKAGWLTCTADVLKCGSLLWVWCSSFISFKEFTNRSHWLVVIQNLTQFP